MEKRMFDFRKALLALNGSEYTFQDLTQEMMKIRVEHLGQLPPELGVGDLISMARERSWITEDTSGRMRVQVGA
jgi:hypothetical protein